MTKIVFEIGQLVKWGEGTKIRRGIYKQPYKDHPEFSTVICTSFGGRPVKMTCNVPTKDLTISTSIN